MPNPSYDPHPPVEVEPRRSFLTSVMAVVTGGIAGLVPMAAGVAFFLDPILRKKKGDAGGFLQAADLSQLPTDGTPVRFTLRADITDAWSFYRDRVMGSVYLRLMPNNQVLAFNDTCPHLGCKVDYQSANSRFFCPCHQSAFDLEGKKSNETPPRDMDELKVEIRDGVVWVKYEKFRIATSKKEVVE
jgi:Rieske Fe-S protein